MARGKQAAALFEVIHGKNREKSKESKLDTPRWWFKSKKRDGGLSSLMEASAPRAMAAPTPRFSDAPVSVAPSPRDDGGGSPSGGLSAFKLVLPSSHTVAFGLMFMAVFGVGFVTGQRFQLHPSPVIAEESSADLLSSQARPDVLDLASASPLTPAHGNEDDGSSPAVANVAANASAFTAPKVDATAALNGRTPATSIVQDKARVIGYNYVVIQSYPNADDAMAAVEKLADNNIEATVIRGLPNWAGTKTWFSVVGTKGFDRIRNNPEFDRYIKSIDLVSAKFAGKSKFKQFAPGAYKWRGAEPAR
ncbi:MAG TPA: hypothetical protein VGN72_13785 [Tepidisphaeraceae bacterium]|jgi:hypothetical protein|nr:hypothetical protein [Tepidisphaeraceae bacterium]